MTEDAAPDTGPDDIDRTVPHSARIWNYWLGGTDNFEVDRAAGAAWIATDPGVLDLARASRAFLGRAVRHLVLDEGVRQFLDIGSGLPTADNTHEVAQRVAPEARVVYVDRDPLVRAHADALLAGTPRGATRFLPVDMSDTDALLAGARETLDLTRPVAAMFLGVLGHVADYAEVRRIVATVVDALPAGSFLVVCDGGEDEAAKAAGEQYAATGAVPYHLRPRRDVERLFEGDLELVEPGLVPVDDWRPDTEVGEGRVVASFAGVARKLPGNRGT